MTNVHNFKTKILHSASEKQILEELRIQVSNLLQLNYMTFEGGYTFAIIFFFDFQRSVRVLQFLDFTCMTNRVMQG
jgi:hypothetical protein